ncbi:hypothetical protein MYX76_12550 [Desulfobacterota bacterium AH_259_B03_O07]|nr:hypothetical protein [Desulfobacterota bacterium AH_259_B03_O07]
MAAVPGQWLTHVGLPETQESDKDHIFTSYCPNPLKKILNAIQWDKLE